MCYFCKIHALTQSSRQSSTTYIIAVFQYIYSSFFTCGLWPIDYWLSSTGYSVWLRTRAVRGIYRYTEDSICGHSSPIVEKWILWGMHAWYSGAGLFVDERTRWGPRYEGRSLEIKLTLSLRKGGGGQRQTVEAKYIYIITERSCALCKHLRTPLYCQLNVASFAQLQEHSSLVLASHSLHGRVFRTVYDVSPHYCHTYCNPM